MSGYFANTPSYQRLLTESKAVEKLRQEIQECLDKRTRLDTTKNENDLLKQELDLLDDDAVVFKKHGPTLGWLYLSLQKQIQKIETKK